jgi:hypothetical protein
VVVRESSGARGQPPRVSFVTQRACCPWLAAGACNCLAPSLPPPSPCLERVGGAHSVGQLGGQGGGDGVEVEGARAVVDGHLPPPPLLVYVAKALQWGRVGVDK